MIVSPYPFFRMTSCRAQNSVDQPSGHRYFVRARVALAAVMLSMQHSIHGRKARILIPDFMCSEVSLYLSHHGFTVDYYPVGRDLAPRWDAIETLFSSSRRPDAFLFVHYFGFIQDRSIAESVCSHYGVALIDDGAHCFPTIQSLSSAEIVFYSPGKLLPIPPIGVLSISARSDLLIQPNRLKKFAFNGTWYAKRLATSIFYRMGYNWFSRPVSGVESDVDIDNGISRRAIESLWKHLSCDVDTFLSIRRGNYSRLISLISDIPSVQLIFPELPSDCIPYAFPILINDASRVTSTLRSNGVYSEMWPGARCLEDVHLQSDDARWLRERVVLLPIHQGLTERHIEYMASTLRACARNIR